MALIRAQRNRLLDRLEDVVDILPRFLVRPFGAVVIFIFFTPRWFLLVLLPSALAGALLPVLVSDFPPAESLPAVLVLVVLVAVIWRQWFQMEALRHRLHAIEEQLKECKVYEDERMQGV